MAYGASPPAPPAAPYDASEDFPGKEDGFERGVDENGAEIYRYEQNDQVYVIPANDYYAWRSDYYPHHGGHLSHEILDILLIGALFHTMAYSRMGYYGGGHYFGRPGMGFASSAAYQSHFNAPVRGANGAVSYPRNTGAGAAGGRVGTPVAQARPVSSGAGGAGYRGGAGGYRGTPVAASRPVGGGGYHSAGGYRGGGGYHGGGRGRG